MSKTVPSLYIHFPFCETKCHYCDFFSLPEGQLPEPTRARAYRAIERELELLEGRLPNSLSTVFLGGGTPSLVPLEVMARILERIPRSRQTEITIEANPSSITPERANAWRAAGINRVSMGVQALEDERLKWLGRVHSRDAALSALDALFRSGFENVSIDYIVGVPGQTTALIRSELAEVLRRFPHIRHISAYLLTLKTSNSKYKQLPDEDTQLEHLRGVSHVLAEEGFEHYEISNFAKPGFRARHNENYWLGGGYAGIGPSAHAFWPQRRERTKNWASLGKYCDLVESLQLPVEWTEKLEPEQERLEFLMLRLRRSEGLDLAEYRRRYGRDLLSERGNWLKLWQRKGLCRVTDRLQLTSDGFFLSDQILSNIS